MRIKANHITQWARERDCQGSLPLLIKKLILASSKNITKCDFPSEDQVYLTGFDGIIGNNDETLFVPKGLSAWEMGCNKEWRPKANEDYRNRTNDPLGINQETTTYIQVSPQLIEREDIEKWEKYRIRQKIWKNVKLYGAIELETWINETPSVERWFAEKIGFPNKGVETLERWWSKWCQLDEDLKISPELVLTDKNVEINELVKQLRNNKKIMVYSNNIEESVAFLYAVISTLPERDLFLSKTLVINDEDSMEFYSQKDNLILIPTYDNYEYYNDADNIIYIHSYSKSKSKIILTDPNKYHFIENLEKMGLPRADAKKYARDSGKNLTTLRTLFNPEIQPPWVRKENIRLLITLFFTQFNDENNIYDKKIIEEIYGEEYEKFLQDILILANEENSPIFKNKNKCYLKSPKNILFIIGKYINSYDLDKIGKILNKIFKKSNRTLKEKKYCRCSGKLKEGILKALILISVFGEDSNMNHISPENWVDNLIYNLFEGESEEFWNNNYVYLKLIAEASPTIFLETIEEKLGNNEDYLLNHLHYLLSALKILALNPFFFRNIIDIHLDLLNKSDNKEILKFLNEIFIPWYINTYTSFNARLNILDYILDKNLIIGWEILEYLLSRESTFLFINNEPYWRIFYEKEFIITQKDLLDFYYEVRMRLLEHIGFDNDKWAFSLNYYTECNDEEFNEKLIERLYEYIKIEPENIVLWNILRENIAKLRGFPKNNDLIKVVPLEDAYYKITPKKLIQRYKYLFDDDWPDVLDSTFDQRDDEITHKRKDAINYIFKMKGFDGIKELIINVKYPRIIGSYMYNKNIDDEVFNVINENKKINEFASQYIFKKSIFYENWPNQIIKRMIDEKFDNGKILLILTSFKANCNIWRKLKLFGEDIQKEYWIQFKYFNYCQTHNECKYYLRKLLEHSSPREIFEFLYRNKTEFDTNLIGDVLLKLNIDDDYIKYNAQMCTSLLKTLHDCNYDAEKLITLEFKLAPSFRFNKIHYRLKIHEKMSKNPKFICNLIKARESADLKLKYHYIYIFENWAIIPGTKMNEQIDYDFLQNWFHDCLKLIEKKDEINYFYSKLGMVLSKSNEDNGVWPKKEVCRFIDEFNNPKINSSFKSSIIMKYSTYYKSLDDGGRREKDISNKYNEYAEKIVGDYPITAKILFEVSKKFENDAKHEKFESDNLDYEYD